MSSRLSLARLRRINMLAQLQKAITLGSPAESEPARNGQMDPSKGPNAKPSSNMDRILGGELVVTIEFAQVHDPDGVRAPHS